MPIRQIKYDPIIEMIDTYKDKSSDRSLKCRYAKAPKGYNSTRWKYIRNTGRFDSFCAVLYFVAATAPDISLASLVNRLPLSLVPGFQMDPGAPLQLSWLGVPHGDRGSA